MTDAQLAILKQKLAQDYVPHLLPLLDQNKPADHLVAKNIARAFCGFTIQKIAKLDAVTAAMAVVDDYEDNGLDAIHYHQPSKKLFLVQGKLRADEPFGQDEANAFCKGVNDLVNQRYDRFNKNIQDRQPELESAMDEAAEIVLVVGHVGEVVSQHAKDALNHFLNDPEKPDERLRDTWMDFGPVQVIEHLLAEQASAPVNAELVIYGEKKIDGPRVTYYEQVLVAELAALYQTHQNALLERNIRYFLGIGDSDVNKAIHGTLEQSPADFFYLSNGVTAVAQVIQPRAVSEGGRKYSIEGLSVINGAQTIASCQHFIATHPQADVSAARVLLTLIQVNQTDAFGAQVTRARNHQNPVSLAQFAALEDVQERLRRELAFDNIVYRYRPEARQATPGVDAISIDDAAYALALFHPDPGLPVTLKKQPASLLDTKGADYPKLFNLALSGRRLANAVRLYRQALSSLGGSELAAYGLEKLIYRHGRYAIIWLTLQSNTAWLDHEGVMSPTDAGNLVSHPLDLWRERVRAEAVADLVAADKGPLAFFRNLTNARPFVVKLRDAGI
jgi:AIPR protein